MELFFAEHWEAVLAFIAVLFSVTSWLVKREFNAIQRHQDRQDARLDAMARELKDVARENADSRRDRQGLHDEIDQHFSALGKQLDMIERGNREAHEGIIRLIKNGGGHRA